MTLISLREGILFVPMPHPLICSFLLASHFDSTTVFIRRGFPFAIDLDSCRRNRSSLSRLSGLRNKMRRAEMCLCDATFASSSSYFFPPRKSSAVILLFLSLWLHQLCDRSSIPPALLPLHPSSCSAPWCNLFHCSGLTLSRDQRDDGKRGSALESKSDPVETPTHTLRQQRLLFFSLMLLLVVFGSSHAFETRANNSSHVFPLFFLQIYDRTREVNLSRQSCLAAVFPASCSPLKIHTYTCISADQSERKRLERECISEQRRNVWSKRREWSQWDRELHRLLLSPDQKEFALSQSLFLLLFAHWLTFSFHAWHHVGNYFPCNIHTHTCGGSFTDGVKRRLSQDRRKIFLVVSPLLIGLLSGSQQERHSNGPIPPAVQRRRDEAMQQQDREID